jgi:hypothetical protein
MAKRRRPEDQTQDPQYSWEAPEGATGASDATSGGGAGAGIPEPETVERSGERVLRGDVNEDRKRLFPERFAKTTSKTKSRNTAGSRKGKSSGRSASTKRRSSSAGRSRASTSARAGGGKSKSARSRKR